MKRFKRRHFIFPILLYLVASNFSGQEIVDCLVATVDREVITLLDIMIYREFVFPAEETQTDPERMLEMIIEIELVAREAKKELTFDKTKLIEALDKLFKLKGEERVMDKMRAYGLTLNDLEPYLEKKYLYEKMLAIRQSQQVNVTLKEIENYYFEKYLAQQKAMKEEARPILEVFSEIESRIRQEKISEQIGLWIMELKNKATIKINQDCLKLLGREGKWPK